MVLGLPKIRVLGIGVAADVVSFFPVRAIWQNGFSIHLCGFIEMGIYQVGIVQICPA